MGRKVVDYTNQRFGKLVVIKLLDKKNKSGNRYWLCKCDCGKQVEVASSNLKSKHSLSCGCNRRTDISNQRFDYLIAIKPTQNKANHDGSVIWECQCDCGNICYKSISDLKTSTNNSCGCQKIYSRGEEKIQQLLWDNKIPFEKEKSFKNCRSKYNRPYRFDFYIDDKYLIEFDGAQHFKHKSLNSAWEDLEVIVERDNYKNEWCKNNNIPLIRIPYTHLEKLCIEDLLLETSNFVI